MAAFRRHLQRPRLTASIVAVVGWLLTMAMDPHAAWAQSVNVYSRTANGNVAPLRVLTGPATALSAPEGDDVDPANNELWVANNGANSIDVYARTATANTPPIRSIVGAATGLNRPVGVDVDVVNNEVFVANALGPTVTVYLRTASGNVAPIRTLGGAATLIVNPFVAVVDTVNNELFVLNVLTQTVRVFSRTANGNVAPLRSFTGPFTFAQDLAVDPTNNEVILADTGNNSVLAFSRTATGAAVPLRTIAGPATTLNTPVGLYVDAVNNEIGVVNTFTATPAITIYSRTASGNVAPLRTITGPVTQLQIPLRIALDPINNEIFVTNRFNAAAAVPTLSEWGMIALVSLLVVGGLLALRRRARVLA